MLKFLTLLYELGLGYSSLNTARSALSSLDCGSTCSVGNHPFICRFMRGVYISRPTKSHYTTAWDVKVAGDYAFVSGVCPLQCFLQTDNW